MSAPKDMKKIEFFASWLNAAMKEAGFDTAYKLSKSSGISTATLSRIFNLQSLPETKTIEKLALALKRPIEEIMNAAGYTVGTSFAVPPSAIETKKKMPKDLLKILEQEDYTLNGRLASPEDKARIQAIIEAIYWDAKERNRRKK